MTKLDLGGIFVLVSFLSLVFTLKVQFKAGVFQYNTKLKLLVDELLIQLCNKMTENTIIMLKATLAYTDLNDIAYNANQKCIILKILILLFDTFLSV